MRIAISTDSDDGLGSPVAQHFGRCPYFALIDLAGSEVSRLEMLANPHAARHEPGQVPAFIASQGAQVMIGAGMGWRALEAFAQHGIEVATGASGTVGEALAQYLAGNLVGARPCAESEEHRADRGPE
jgi:predicted Fe-Mo cluster-binding NifX family protein